MSCIYIFTIESSVVPDVGREEIGDGDGYADEEHENVGDAEIGKEVVCVLTKLALDGEHEHDNRVGEYTEEKREREENGENDGERAHGSILDGRDEIVDGYRVERVVDVICTHVERPNSSFTVAA